MNEDRKLPSSNYRVIRWFQFDQFVPEETVTSYWISSKTFFIIRLILTLYSTIVIWTDIGLSAAGLDHFFVMFTHFTFIGLHAYLVTSSVYHFRYLYSKSLDFYFNQPVILNYLYVYLYHTVITFNIVTPVVYWSILNGTAVPGLSAWINTSVHGVSFFLMIFNVLLGREKVLIRMILPVLATVVLYMLFTFVIHATQGYWVYPFLDWKQGGKAAIWYVAVGLIVVISFFIQYLIHFLRDFIARKKGFGHRVQELESKLEQV
ncbi:hypothetical protein G6F47_012242 [Rhizopus delemar]|nr:hypothetical protein G6F54_011864 [Rhizopus delemar]KAG1512031.1 hypothetical protein G6F53_005494 [Rhizopus delemar]KAG1582311.1 hypothetical protein G6F47_012242 [Rhizopus delemar]